MHMPVVERTTRGETHRRAAVAVLAICVFLLTGCAQTIALQPAPDANNPLCANVMVRLPDAIRNMAGELPQATGVSAASSLDRVWTDAQATAAWGTGGAVTMVCGVPEPGPVPLTCMSWSGIDWLVDANDPARTKMITYGRNPAVQVEFDPTKTTGTAVWDSLAIALSEIPAHKSCEPTG